MNDETRDPHAESQPPYDPAAIDRARAAMEAVPERVGPYRILERIGGGGMGEVYVAEQTSPIKRRVAIKLIKAGMDTRQVVARFEAERQALAMMDHPNIARVFDAGSTDTGRPYFVMELVRGVPITQFCDSQKFNTRQRVELLIPVCLAVQHAHQKGIIHRDLKPTNVLVTLNDGKPTPKVIDFGIAKATGPSLTDKTVYTEFHAMIGTPAYMSPEQAEMSSLDIDTRSDIYSLGVLAYELLTGTTPFDTTRLIKAGLAEIQRIIKEEDPPRPSLRISTLGDRLTNMATQRATEPTRIGKLVAGELDWIVMKALEKDRRRRYETANDLAADLGRHLVGEPVVAGPVTWRYRSSKFVRKHRGPVIAAAVLGVVLTVGIAGTTTQMIRARHAESLAQQQQANAIFELRNTAIQLGKESGLDQTNMIISVPDNSTGKPDWYTIIDWESREADGTPKIYGAHVAKGVTFPDVNSRELATSAGSIKALARCTTMALSYIADARLKLATQRDAAETEAYIANLALAQAAMQADRWPEARQRLDACPESKRGWEWTFLNARIQCVVFTKVDSDGAVNLQTNSSDGQFTVVRVRDESTKYADRIQVIRSADRSVAELPIFEQRGIASVGFLPKSHRIMMISDYSWGPAQLAIFELDGRKVAECGGSWNFAGDMVFGVKVSPDGQILYPYEDSGRLLPAFSSERLDDPVSLTRRLFFRKTPSNYEKHFEDQKIMEASLAKESGNIVQRYTASSFTAATNNGQLIVLNNGKIMMRVSPLPEAFALSPCGRLFTAEKPDVLRVWDTQSSRELMTIQLRANATQLRFTPDGTRLIIDFADGSMEIWDTRDYAARQKDRDVRFDEIPAARQYVQALLATPAAAAMVADGLKAVVRSDASISTLRKLVAIEQLDLELQKRKSAERATTQPAKSQPAAGGH